MKPNAAEDSVFLQDASVTAIADEAANGEYGLVINGHSLVRLRRGLTIDHKGDGRTDIQAFASPPHIGVRPGSEHGAGVPEDGVHVQGGDLL